MAVGSPAETPVGRRIAGAVLVGAALLATPGIAQADLSPPQDSQAKAHNDQGNRYYKLQRFEKAIQEYEKGAVIEDAPIFLYNLGQCHRQLGNYDEAIWFYTRYLKSGNVDDEVAFYVRDFIKVMKAKKELELKEKPPVEPEPPDARPADQVDRTADRAPVPRDAPAQRRWYADTLGWGLAAAGVAVGATGAYFLANAAGLESEANAEPDVSRRQELRDTASSRRAIGAILAAGGGVALITGLVKLAIVPDAAKTRTAVWLTPQPQGLLIVGRF